MGHWLFSGPLALADPQAGIFSDERNKPYSRKMKFLSLKLPRVYGEYVFVATTAEYVFLFLYRSLAESESGIADDALLVAVPR